jgi:hypothetical protein
MAPITKAYGMFAQNQFGAAAAARIDWVNDVIKATLHTSAYVPNQDAHTVYTDLSNELITGGGYTAGGVALSGKTLTYNAPAHEARMDAVDPQWPGATFTVRFMVLRKDTGTPGTSPLILYVDFGADVSSAGGTFTAQLDATGILKAVVV